MKVLIISHGHPSFSIGGAEVASHNLFRAINETSDADAFYLSRAPAFTRRHAMTPLMSLGHGERETFLQTGDWNEFWLSNAGLEDLENGFAQYLIRIRPEIVHFHHIIGIGVEAIALVRRVLPLARIVITFHEYLSVCFNHGQMVKAAKRELCKRSSPAACAACFPHHSPAEFSSRAAHIRGHLALADAFVSPSRFLIDRYVDWALPRERFHFIENGVHGKQAPPRSTGPGSRHNRFAFFGQITEFKGLHVLLDAVSRIPEEVWGDATLKVFGGNLEYQPEAFREQFRVLLESVGRRARFGGSYRQDEMADLMEEVDWVIVPSIWWENSPVVIQEAFFHRRPLIVSGVGGMAEKVRHNVDGLHFRVSSPESLAESMSNALLDSSLWPRLAGGCSAPPSPTMFANEHLRLYDKLTRAATSFLPEAARNAA